MQDKHPIIRLRNPDWLTIELVYPAALYIPSELNKFTLRLKVNILLFVGFFLPLSQNIFSESSEPFSGTLSWQICEHNRNYTAAVHKVQLNLSTIDKYINEKKFKLNSRAKLLPKNLQMMCLHTQKEQHRSECKVRDPKKCTAAVDVCPFRRTLSFIVVLLNFCFVIKIK